MAVRDALASGGLDRRWFEALADTEEEAAAAHAEYEAQRMLHSES